MICGLLGLVACNQQDWQTRAVSRAEAQMRVEVDDASATFSGVQVTGNSRTGQTCGFVSAKVAGTAPERTTRFIVYIDGTAGPFVEANMGSHSITQERFDFAWQHDCLGEGYKS